MIFRVRHILMIIVLLLGIAINVPCDSVVSVCPNTEVKFTCSLQSIRLIWIVPESLTDNFNSDTMVLDPLFTTDPTLQTITDEPYTAVIIEGNNSYILSELTFTIPQQLNGIKEISCSSNGNDEGKKTCMFKPTGVNNNLYNPHFQFVIIIPQ